MPGSASTVDAPVKTLASIKVAMTETPVKVPDALFEGLEEHFDNRQLVELTSCIAWENYRARFDHAFGIEAQGFSEGAYCPMPAR